MSRQLCKSHAEWDYKTALACPFCFAEAQKEAKLWKAFALALNREDISQDEVIKAHQALSEANLWEDPA